LDPLIHRGNKKVKHWELFGRMEKDNAVVHTAVMISVPFLTFLFCLLVSWWFWHNQPIVWVVLQLLVFGYSFWIGNLAKGKKMWLARLFVLNWVANLAGVLCGFYIYYTEMVYYESMKDMRRYSNIAASQQAAQFIDASMLMFTTDSQVDPTRAIGYKDAKSGDTICVAPIVDASMGGTDPISFWAVGKNCCSSRASFQCDGATEGGARSGLLVLDLDYLVTPQVKEIIDWFGLSKPLDAYYAAIRLDQAAYATVKADWVRFVRWAKDPFKIRKEFRDKGISWFVKFTVIYFFFSIVIGILVTPRGKTPPPENS